MLVRPIQAFASSINGTVISPADVLRDTNAHVKAQPDMFEPVTPTRFGDGTDVEEASARPGERRNTSR
jgi:hypothetical protein